ncbi:MAG: hypothetical protein IMX01_05050 [Limnochordaceae bacterium]|nr:hypothetical protein [Limnochordaceae bacterium]
MEMGSGVSVERWGKVYRVPRQDGELLCDPAWPEWPRVVAAGARERGGEAGSLGPAGWPLPLFRQQCRQTVRRLAAWYTRQLDGAGGVSRWAIDQSNGVRGRPRRYEVDRDPQATFLVTGHQPLFAHPGIWAKNVLVALAAQRWPAWTGRPAYALNLVVDSDVADDPAPLVPSCQGLATVGEASRSGGDRGEVSRSGVAQYDAGEVPSSQLSHAKVAWRGLKAGVWEELPIPTWDSLDGWLDQLTHSFQGLETERILAQWQAHLPLLAAAWQQDGALPVWTTRARRLWEKLASPSFSHYDELPVSWLSRTRWFFWYMLDLAGRAAHFQQIYNAALASYRQVHRLRTRALPFPDLQQAEGWVELPFWVKPPQAEAGSGRRRTLWVSEGGKDGELQLAAGNEEGPDLAFGVVRIPRPSSSLSWAAWRALAWQRWRASGWQVRPKALTLTLFARRYLADLFVHGVGGGQYDQVTEQVAVELDRTPLAPMAVVSFTSHLPIEHQTGVEEQYRRLQWLRRDLRYNPQRHLERLHDGNLREIAERWAQEKERLITALAAAPTRRARRRVHRQLTELTRRLARLFEADRESCDQQLAALAVELRRKEIATEREYPFFLYDPAQLYARIVRQADTPAACPAHTRRTTGSPTEGEGEKNDGEADRSKRCTCTCGGQPR